MNYEHGATYAGAIVKSVSVENMVNQRAAVLERFSAAMDLLTEARELANTAGLGFPRLKIDENRYGVYSMLDPSERTTVDENVRKLVDTGGWRHLMNESGMRTFMDAKARAEWDRQVEEGKVPALTFENVAATFTALHAGRGDMFKRGVIEMFKALNWCYKTNRPFAFGKRIVVRFIRHERHGSGLGSPNHRKCEELDDLVRVFSVLDGKVEPDHRNGVYSALTRADHATSGENVVELEYFSLRTFKNGNGHLTFKRLDLVDKMNQILAESYPGALPHDKHAA